VLVAQGDPSAAADVLAPVVDRYPLPELAIARADDLAAAGRATEATQAYGLVDVEFQLQRSSGVQIDLELALYLADHRPGADALAQAQSAVAARPNVGAWDALAWARYTAGDVAGAQAALGSALQLGTIDPRILWHAAAITAAGGDATAARQHLQALFATNWRFSAVRVADIQALAAQLGITPPPS
jgi:Flp pilus assembly protein TadD